MANINLSKDLAAELKAIRRDLEYIKSHMVDVDSILTSEEEVRVEKSLKEHRDGKTLRLEDFEKQIK